MIQIDRKWVEIAVKEHTIVHIIDSNNERWTGRLCIYRNVEEETHHILIVDNKGEAIHIGSYTDKTIETTESIIDNSFQYIGFYSSLEELKR